MCILCASKVDVATHQKFQFGENGHRDPPKFPKNNQKTYKYGFPKHDHMKSKYNGILTTTSLIHSFHCESLGKESPKQYQNITTSFIDLEKTLRTHKFRQNPHIQCFT